MVFFSRVLCGVLALIVMIGTTYDVLHRHSIKDKEDDTKTNTGLTTNTTKMDKGISVELKSIKVNVKPPQYNNIENSHDKHYARMESMHSSLGSPEDQQISVIQINNGSTAAVNGSVPYINGSAPYINGSAPSINGSTVDLVSKEKQTQEDKSKKPRKSMHLHLC